MLEILTGQIQRITYSSPDSGFTIAKMQVADRMDLVTVVGQLSIPAPGEILELKGQWKDHPKYGRQFEAVESHALAPTTIEGIKRYLSSGLIKGIGPVLAKRIVKAFGPDTLTVIAERIDRLGEVEGVGRKRIEIIGAAWAEQKEIRGLMLFLQEHGVGPTYATKIFKTYGRQSLEILRADPFRLARDISGIGFLTADRIAAKLGLPADSPLRVEAGLLHVLDEQVEEGHCFVPRANLLERTSQALEVSSDLVETALAGAGEKNYLVVESQAGTDPAVYAGGLHRAETGVARQLKELLTRPKTTRTIDEEKALEWVQERLGLALAPEQREAVRRATRDKVLVITGGPGTGKTTIIRSILEIMKRLTPHLVLAAPTGRAAKRMSEATGQEARTIHRWLEFNPREGRFKRNETEPLEADLIVVDETSMIDIRLMNHLLRAAPATATLILVGDVDQLPSVGPGRVLQDIIDSGAVPVVRLTEIFRQAQGSAIIVNAHRINQGLLPVPPDPERGLTDFYLIEQPDPAQALRVIVDLIATRIPRRFGLDPIRDIQVLSPMHRGLVGTDNLNLELQKTLNPDREGLTRGGRTLRVGDKVMQIRNNYDRDVFNGDVGQIAALDLENQEVTVFFDGRSVQYDFSDLDELILAYAATVHKAQGSEYPAVIMPVMTQHHLLLKRNLIYTAVTRGRKLVVLVGTQQALATAVRDNRAQVRHTALGLRLKNAL